MATKRKVTNKKVTKNGKKAVKSQIIQAGAVFIMVAAIVLVAYVVKFFT